MARPKGPMPPKSPMPMRQARSCYDVAHQRREGQEQRRGDEGAKGHGLLAVAVGEAPPDRGEEAGEQRRDADEDARPEGRLLRVLDPELAHEEGQEGNHEGEAHEDHEHHGRHHALVALPGRGARQGQLHESRRTSPTASPPRSSRLVCVRPVEPRARATTSGARQEAAPRVPAGRPRRRATARRGSSPCRWPCSPLPFPAMARARASTRGPGPGGRRARLGFVHEPIHEAPAPALERPLDPLDLHEVDAQPDDQPALPGRRVGASPRETIA